MQVYFNKKTDKEISEKILKLKIIINNKKFDNIENELIIKTQYETLKWVVGKQNEE